MPLHNVIDRGPGFPAKPGLYVSNAIPRAEGAGHNLSVPGRGSLLYCWSAKCSVESLRRAAASRRSLKRSVRSCCIRAAVVAGVIHIEAVSGGQGERGRTICRRSGVRRASKSCETW